MKTKSPLECEPTSAGTPWEGPIVGVREGVCILAGPPAVPLGNVMLGCEGTVSGRIVIGRVDVGGGGTRRCHRHGQEERYEIDYTGVAGT